MTAKAANIQVDKLRTFEGHPFKVLDDEDMGNLIEIPISARKENKAYWSSLKN